MIFLRATPFILFAVFPLLPPSFYGKHNFYFILKYIIFIYFEIYYYQFYENIILFILKYIIFIYFEIYYYQFYENIISFILKYIIFIYFEIYYYQFYENIIFIFVFKYIIILYFSNILGKLMLFTRLFYYISNYIIIL